MHRIVITTAAMLLAAATLEAQAPTPPVRTLIIAGRLIDGTSEEPLTGQAILVEGDSIVAIGPRTAIESKAGNAKRLDLSAMTVLPGLMDNHTHILLQGDITAQDYDDRCSRSRSPTAPSARPWRHAPRSTTDSPPCATSRPRVPCMRTWT